MAEAIPLDPRDWAAENVLPPNETPAETEQAQRDREEADRARAEIRRILALGTDITLANGDTITLIYTARMMGQIEAKFGSIDAYFSQVSSRKHAVITLFAFTLHLALKQPVDAVWDLIDTRQMGRYQEAMLAAAAEAMGVDDDSGNAEGPTPAPSPGASSSTSPSSNSTSRRRTSGT